ncbi:hypothetical protein KUTeg_009371 [Tegillarca granosa]|uniref:RNA helicase n=1 Tax=Tegillarca granosa TaxID=220873 RepID=A0ABQ9F8N3_TEGGR|nr:hypothetical protein KUTeg_009371 [Tegillarca granosa]
MGNSKSKTKTDNNDKTQTTLSEREKAVVREQGRSEALNSFGVYGTRHAERKNEQNEVSYKEYQPFQNIPAGTGIQDKSQEKGSKQVSRTTENRMVQASVVRENYLPDTRQKENNLVKNASTTKTSDNLNTRATDAQQKIVGLTQENPQCNNTIYVHETPGKQTTNSSENFKTTRNYQICENNVSISCDKLQPFKIDANQSEVFIHNDNLKNGPFNMNTTSGDGIVQAPVFQENYLWDTRQKEINLVKNASNTKPSDSLNNHDSDARHQFGGLTRMNPQCNDTLYAHKSSGEHTTNSSEKSKTTGNCKFCVNSASILHGKLQPFKIDANKPGVLTHDNHPEKWSFNLNKTSENGIVKASIVNETHEEETKQNKTSGVANVSNSTSYIPNHNVTKSYNKLEELTINTPQRSDMSSNTTNVHKTSIQQTINVSGKPKTAAFGNSSDHNDYFSQDENKLIDSNYKYPDETSLSNSAEYKRYDLPVSNKLELDHSYQKATSMKPSSVCAENKVNPLPSENKHIPVKNNEGYFQVRGRDFGSQTSDTPINLQNRSVESITEGNFTETRTSNSKLKPGSYAIKIPWQCSSNRDDSYASDGSSDILVDELDKEYGCRILKNSSCDSDSRYSSRRSSIKSGCSVDDLMDETSSTEDLDYNCDDMYDIDDMSDNSSLMEDEDVRPEEDVWRTKIQELAQKLTKISEDVSVSKSQIYVFKICALVEKDEVPDFIKSRLPSNLKFECLESEHKKRNTIVTLKFPSKRMALRSKSFLHQGNRKSRVKIWIVCEKLQSAVSLENLGNGNVFQQHVDDILKRADSTIYTHDQKIEGVRMKLDEIKNEIERKGFLKLLEFESYQTLIAERKTLRQALGDQLKELQLQKSEFNIYMQQLSERLDSIDIGIEWKTEMQDLKKSFGIECVRLREALPIYARKSDIQQTIKENKVSVILGETGSGKSTQLPQYVYRQPWVGNGLIVCTQPRKVAAISLATRVAAEIATTVGQEVGYHVGMNTKKSKSTKILYMTDHCLLNECLKDNTLSAYSCIIIDEAHERSIFTDLLLGMIKRCLTKRDDLRIIVTSATIDPGVFQTFFNNCPVMKVSGRMFPVEVIWKKQVPGQEPFENYENNAVQKALDIHLNEPPGDVLVFLTSPSEAENCCKSFQNKLKDKTSVVCLQLHSRVQSSEQQLVFRATPIGKRKIVFATNSAETSITIPNIKYVIDTGLMKENRYDPLKNMSTLSVTMVTKSNAEQRKGRAGRTMAGKCYRLYTEHDFESMKPTNIPELLRINLGQAILKLFELGVNPFEFDFVQSPDRKSMEATLSLLEDIGAIAQSLITELGKWISKLPVDPKFGAFIYQGLQNEIGSEAIVIAAFVSAAGSVFYRGGSQAQKDLADRIKTKFCHPGGDFLSYLNVFREWFKQPEREKGKWCVENSVNGKTLKGVREIVNEILLILRKEHNKNVKLEFSKTPDKIEDLLIRLLFKTLRVNISHYLGHKDAGYLYVEKGQFIHLHPSSCLLSLGCNPEWKVFLKVMRSSKDYAMEVVSVSEEILNEAIEEGWIKVDKEEARSRRVKAIATFHVGSQVFWDFVGPRYSNLRELEQEFLEIIQGSPGVIEADKARGHIKIYAAETFTDVANMLLTEELEYILETLRNEESEQRLSQHTDKIRAVMGQGASVQTFYMPDQYKTVDIYCSYRMIHTIDDDILELFEEFGTIQNHWLRKINKISKSSKMCFLGKVTFVEMDSAAAAVSGTQCNDGIQARSPIKQNNNDLTGFKAVISWCRRPSKGFGFVELLRSRHIDKADRLRSVSVGGSTVLVQKSRKNDRELYVKNLRKIVNEDVLRQGIADALRIDAYNDIGRVNVVREKVETTKSDIQQFQRRLRGMITQYVKHGNFEVDIRIPKPHDRVYIAYVRFSDPDDGARACREISYSFAINGETITMKADLSTSIYIHKNIYEKIADTLRGFLEGEQEESDVITKTKTLRNGSFVIDLHADNPDELVATNRVIQKLVRGHKLSCQQNQRSEILFTRNGKDKLTSIMRKTNTFINIDNRVMEITIHGNSRNRDHALKKINDYLTRLKSLSAKQVELKGEDKPIGVMKALLIKYGITLDQLRKNAELVNIDLDHKNHRLQMTGTEKAIEIGCSLINDVITSVTVNSALLQNVDDPECAICFTSVDDYEQLYRLECCGHPYHKECIELQMVSAVKNKDIPVKCSFDKCERLFAWKDILNLARLGYTSISDLVSSSVSSFVAKNKERFRYCITADCPIVYRVDKKGKCFRCPDCEIRICTSCHIQFHDGLTCAMYNSAKGDKSIALWIRGDPDRRKLCPSCRAPIEKIDGCNHMQCGSCDIHICWVCLKGFLSSQECYAHLAKIHGSFG